LRAVYGLLSGARSISSNTDEDGRGRLDRIDWGDLARLSPVSAFWGTDRGLPVDRHYIEQFLSRHRADIHGRVLEVKDPKYATTFSSQMLDVEVLDIDASNLQATLIADLTRADQVSSDQFDCFILTQTLHIIYDFRSALHEAVRLLKTDGVLLCTIPAVSRVNYEDGGLQSGDFWRLTRAAVQRLFSEVFQPEHVSIETYGNVRVCTAFLYGLATEDLDLNVLKFNDPWFPLVHCVRAVKQSPPQT
jgi:SAM-dependent methyltransferase